jgi:hypothetical protein
MLYKSDSKKFWYVKDYVNNILVAIDSGDSSGFDKSLLGGGDILTSPNVDEAGKKFNAKDQLKKLKEQAGAKLESVTADFASNLQKDLTSAVTGAISSQLNSLFLGNIYGFSAASIVNGGEAGIRGAVTGKLENNNIKGKFNENVFGK